MLVKHAAWNSVGGIAPGGLQQPLSTPQTATSWMYTGASIGLPTPRGTRHGIPGQVDVGGRGSADFVRLLLPAATEVVCQ